jgi:hypothetical protein
MKGNGLTTDNTQHREQNHSKSRIKNSRNGISEKDCGILAVAE